MKKNDIIKMLEAIPGNPEIMLWNGMVGDVQNIDPVLIKERLVKYEKEPYLRAVEHETRGDGEEWTEAERKYWEKVWNAQGYEMNQFVYADDIKKGLYRAKQVYIMQAKLSGKKTFDRFGEISY